MPDTPYQSLDSALTTDEQAQLQTYEEVIERGLKTFYDVGNALLDIRDCRLYRQQYSTFEAYCEVRWQLKRPRAYELMDAAKVARNLSEISDIRPERESHAAPLVPLEPEAQRLVWEVVQQTAPAGKVTAQHVKSVVNVFKEVVTTGAIDDGTGEQIAVADVVKAAITEETYERMMRQEQYIASHRRESEWKREEAAKTPAPEGKYKCIVIDPPWPVHKIEREVRPNQKAPLDYPTMTLAEIAALPLPDLAFDDGCHLYLWTTQKFLPAAIGLIAQWGFNYQCLMTWVKPTGMTPYSWMYNTEHVVFARRGNLPLERNGLKLAFDAPATGHSIKPDAFYERVMVASPGPRLDMFARRQREGFAVWGNEVPCATT